MRDRLRVLYCDHLALMRGKYLRGDKIGDGSTRFCQSNFGVHFDKDLLPAPGAAMLEGLPDMELCWREADIRDSWEPDTKIVVGDLYDASGAALGVCARQALKRAIADWEALGYRPQVGIELEAFAFEIKPDAPPTPYHTPGGFVYGTGPFADPLGVNDAIWEAADALDMPLELITSEYDVPQFEYTLTYDDALQAVDDIALFKLMAREVAFEQGVLLSFLPKPIADVGGSGMHINFSLQADAGDGIGTGGIDGLTDLGRRCVAGLVHHHAGLAGLLAPIANSYARLQPGTLSGYWRNWGGDHRNVTTRVSSEGGKRARLEHRMADAAANPYTAVAAVLQAARLGVENDYALPAPETGDGFEATDATEGIAENLAGAIAALDADAPLKAAVGPLLVDNHVFMKQAEVEKTAALSEQALLDFYLYYV
ncbi:MAG: glutamine synthetase family protein [Pseudomonadota bacterium]